MKHKPNRRKEDTGRPQGFDYTKGAKAVFITIIATIAIGLFSIIGSAISQSHKVNSNSKWIESHQFDYNHLHHLMIEIRNNQKHISKQLDRIIRKVYPQYSKFIKE